MADRDSVRGVASVSQRVLFLAAASAERDRDEACRVDSGSSRSTRLSRENYGAVRVPRALVKRGTLCHRKTVAKVMAVSRQLPDSGLIADSDRGVQYASEHDDGSGH